MYGHSGTDWTSGWITDSHYTVDELDEGRTYYFTVVARDAFGHGSMGSEYVYTTVDMTPPEINITRPGYGWELHGSTPIIGTVDEANPSFYSVRYWSISTMVWFNIARDVPVPSGGNISALWDTTRIPDGVYTLRVDVTDIVGLVDTIEFEVVLVNAHPTVSPLDIGFTDENPEIGDRVTVMVVVRNDGDTPALDLTVDVYDNGVFLETITGVDIDGHSLVVLFYELTVTGKHEITVRVTTDIYDTGEMEWGRRLEAKEDEADSTTVSNTVAWVGMLAIVLAVIAIALNLVDRMRKPSSEEDVRVDAVDDWVESKDEGS
jgi:hypothetical protein